MKEKTYKINCEYNCGMTVDWMICDDDGENCHIASAVQCGYCGKLNTKRPAYEQ